MVGLRGDRSRRFEAVALPHLDALYRTALRLTRNRAEAEVVVHETYREAAREFRRLTPGTSARAWLVGLLRRVVLSRLRGAEREAFAREPALAPEALEPPETEPATNPEDEFFRTVLHGDIERALGALPPAFREVVILADLEGFRYREIATALGCPLATVAARLARGRALLRRALRAYAGEHGSLRDEP